MFPWCFLLSTRSAIHLVVHAQNMCYVSYVFRVAVPPTSISTSTPRGLTASPPHCLTALGSSALPAVVATNAPETLPQSRVFLDRPCGTR